MMAMVVIARSEIHATVVDAATKNDVRKSAHSLARDESRELLYHKQGTGNCMNISTFCDMLTAVIVNTNDLFKI
jgi:hypothetical protein